MKKVKVIFPDGSTADVDEKDLQSALSAGAKLYSEAGASKMQTVKFADGSQADIDETDLDAALSSGGTLVKKKEATVSLGQFGATALQNGVPKENGVVRSDGLSEKYETKLSAQDEPKFQSWLDSQYKQGHIEKGDYDFYKKNGYGYGYDFRAAFEAGEKPQVSKVDGEWHWSDIGKKPNHPTFSNQSKYHNIDGFVGGKWDGEAFVPPVEKKQTFEPKSIEEFNLEFEQLTGHKEFSLSEPVKPEGLLSQDSYSKQKKAFEERKYLRNRDIQEKEIDPVIDSVITGTAKPLELSALYDKPYGKKIVSNIINNTVPELGSMAFESDVFGNEKKWDEITKGINVKNRPQGVEAQNQYIYNLNSEIFNTLDGLEIENVFVSGGTGGGAASVTKSKLPQIDTNNATELGQIILQIQDAEVVTGKDGKPVDKDELIKKINQKLFYISSQKEMNPEIFSISDKTKDAISRVNIARDRGESIATEDFAKDDENNQKHFELGLNFIKDARPGTYTNVIKGIKQRGIISDTDFEEISTIGQQIYNQQQFREGAVNPDAIGKETDIKYNNTYQTKRAEYAGILSEEIKRLGYKNRAKVPQSAIDKAVALHPELTNREILQDIRNDEASGGYGIVKGGGLNAFFRGVALPIKSINQTYNAIVQSPVDNYLDSKKLDLGDQKVPDKKGNYIESLPSESGNIFNQVLEGTGQFVTQVLLARGVGKALEVPTAGIAQRAITQAESNWIAAYPSTFITMTAQTYGSAYTDLLQKTGDPSTARFGAYASTVVQSAIEAFIMPDVKIAEKAEGLLKSVTSKFSNDIVDLVKKGVSKDAAKTAIKGFAENATKIMGGNVIEENLQQITDYVTESIFSPSTIKDRDLGKELWETTKGVLVQMAIPTLLGAAGETKQNKQFSKDALHTGAINFNEYKGSLDKALVADEITPEQHNEAIKILTAHRGSINNAPKRDANGNIISTDNQLEYAFQETVRKVNEDKATNEKDAVQKEFYESKAKEADDAKRKIFYQEEVKPEAAVPTPEQEVITKALAANEISGAYKFAAEDAVTTPEKAKQFLADAKDQIGNQVASAAGDPSALAKEAFGSTIADHVAAKPEEVAEPMPTEQEFKEAEKEPITSKEDAETRLSNGERLFAFHEMDEGGTPLEIKNIGDLQNHSYDLLVAVPRKENPFAAAPPEAIGDEKTVQSLKNLAKDNPEKFGEVSKKLDEYPDEEMLDISESDNAELISEQIAKEYTKAKKDGSNPELVKAVDKALSPTPESTTTAKPTEVKSNKDVSKVFNRLLKDEHETDDYGIDGLIADWNGAEYNRNTERLEFTDTRSSTGTWKLSKKDFINYILSGEAAKEIPSAKNYIDKVRKTILDELGIKESPTTAKEKEATTIQEGGEKKETQKQKIATIEDLTEPRDMVLKYFGNGGKIHPSAITELYGGKDPRLHAKTSPEGERKARIGLLANSAPSIKRLAEKFLEDNPNERYSDQDFRNAIEGVLQDHISMGSAARELIDKYITKSVAQELTPEEYKEMDDVGIAKRAKIVEELPEKQQQDLMQLLEKYEDAYGNIDWGKLEKDSNGFEPKILSLSIETQNALDAIIQKNISETASQPNNAVNKDGTRSQEKGSKEVDENPSIKEDNTADEPGDKSTEKILPAKELVTETTPGTGEPPPAKPAAEETGGKDRLNEKGILNHLFKAKNIPEAARQGFEAEGLKYETKSQQEAQDVAKAVIDEMGIDDAVLAAEAMKFDGDVNSLIFAESLNRLKEQEDAATTPEGKLEAAMKFAEVGITYDKMARYGGRFNAAINHFYKKSPLGIIMIENANRQKGFDEWSKPKDKSWKEFFTEMMKEPDFEAVVAEQVKEGMKQERAEARKARIKKVDDFFDNAKDKFKGDGALYSTVIPPKIITTALEGMKQAYRAGEKVAELVEKAIDYISEQMGNANWDKNKFRDEWNNKLQEKEPKKPLTDEEVKQKILDKFRTKLKGLTDKQKEDVVRKSFKKIVESGGLDYQDFRKIIAEVTGRGELTDAEAIALKELVKKTNEVDGFAKKALEERTPEALKRFRDAEFEAGKATKELNALIYTKPDIIKRLTSIMQLSTLGIPALINNPIYNVWNQISVRLPVGVVNDLLDRSIGGIAKLMGKRYEKEWNVFETQAEFFNKLGFGTRESVTQLLTGLNRQDYIQKEVYGQRIRPASSIRDLWAYAQGKKELTKAQVVDKAIQATVGIPAEVVARVLNLGDKPQRFAAEGAQASTFAKNLGLKDMDYKLFIEFPREEAYRIYREKGLSEAEAGKKADYVKDVIIKEGQRSTFQQDNLLNDIITGAFTKIGGKDSGTSNLVKALTISPYIKIPSNAFWSYYNLVNPEVAMMQSMVHGARAYALRNKDDNSSKLQLREARYWLGHAVAGIAMRAVVVALVQAGVFVPANSGDESKKEREGETFFEQQGTINWTKLITLLRGGDPSKVKGGLVISNRWFGQFGTVGNAIARKYEDATPEQRDAQNDFWNIVFGGLEKDALKDLQQGVFSNSSAILSSLDASGYGGKRYLLNVINMMANIVQPAAIAQINRAAIPVVTSNKADSFLGELKNSFAQRSWLFRNLSGVYPPSKVSIWGEPIQKGGSTFMRLFGISQTNPDAFAEPIYQDYKKTGDTGFFPPAVPPILNEKQLNTEQYNKLSSYIGEARKDYVAPYVNGEAQIDGWSESYDNIEDLDIRKKVLNYLYELGRFRGVEKFLEDYPEFKKEEKTDYQKEIEDKYKEFKKSVQK